MPTDTKFLDQCRVCSKRLSLNSPRQTSQHSIFKTTKCCDEHCLLHIKCAQQFAHLMDPSYKFDSDTYVEDANTSLYCFLSKKLLLLW